MYQKLLISIMFNLIILFQIESSGDCRRFSKPPHVFYRTLLFFLDYKFIADDWDITYVTHLSYDRIYLMENIAQIWHGPISFTLYVSDAELVNAMKLISDSLVLNTRTDIAYHAVFKQEVSILEFIWLVNTHTF